MPDSARYAAAGSDSRPPGLSTVAIYAHHSVPPQKSESRGSCDNPRILPAPISPTNRSTPCAKQVISPDIVPRQVGVARLVRARESISPADLLSLRRL